MSPVEAGFFARMEPSCRFLKLGARCCCRIYSRSAELRTQGVSMKLYAPNIALFVIAGCLAMLGVLAAFPIELPIPALTGNSSWYIFLAWFLLAAGSVVPPGPDSQSK